MNNDYSIVSLENFSKANKRDVLEKLVVSNDHLAIPDIRFRHPYLLNEIAVFICLQGGGKIKINLHEYEFEVDSMITILPGSVVEFTMDTSLHKIKYVIFSFDYFSDINIPFILDVAKRIEQNPCIHLTGTDRERMLEHHTHLAKHYIRDSFLYRKEMTKVLVSAFLLEVVGIYSITRFENVAVKGRKQEVLQQFITLVYQNFKTNRSVRFYADKMCMSSKYLGEVVKSTSNKSPQEWINELTILAIKAMLKSSDHTVLQISEDLNFPNPSFFGKYFKKQVGQTPLEYRKGK